MKKRIVALLLCSALTAWGAYGCGEKSPESSSIEPVTVARPEGGWTIEELLSVTYLCGKQLTYPLTVEALGEDFTVETDDVLALTGRTTTNTKYKGEYYAPCIFWDDDVAETEPKFEDIKYISFCLPENADDDFDFSLNGVGFGSTREEVREALGRPDEQLTEESFRYFDKEDEKRKLIVNFIDGKLFEFIYAFADEPASLSASRKIR